MSKQEKPEKKFDFFRLFFSSNRWVIFGNNQSIILFNTRRQNIFFYQTQKINFTCADILFLDFMLCSCDSACSALMFALSKSIWARRYLDKFNEEACSVSSSWHLRDLILLFNSSMVLSKRIWFFFSSSAMKARSLNFLSFFFTFLITS